MVAGEGSRDQHDARAMAYRDPAKLDAILDAIEATAAGSMPVGFP